MGENSVKAKVRPLSNPSLEKASLLGAARIYVNKDLLIALSGSLDHGKLCLVELADDSRPPKSRQATLWTLPDKGMSPNVVLMTRAFLEAAGFSLGDQVRISLVGTVPELEDVVLEDISGEPQELEVKLPPKKEYWSGAISHYLDRADQIFPGMVFEGVNFGKIRRNFKVTSVNSQTNNLARFTQSSNISIATPNDGDASDNQMPSGDLVVTGVPGLPHEVATINNFLHAFSRPLLGLNERESCGFVIHGGPNTGKTFILERIAATRWGQVHWIDGTDKLSSIREKFKLARSQRPSMVFIDSLNDILTKDRTNCEAVIQALCAELDALSEEIKGTKNLPKVVVIATCSDYLLDVPTKLQKRSRFSKNIALTIPAANERLEILKFLNPPIAEDEKEQVLENLTRKTHAYTADDLARLISNAWEVLSLRLQQENVDLTIETDNFLTGKDFDGALRRTRPSAMHDINLKPPTVHWKDIGGQEGAKKVLTRMIKSVKGSASASKVFRNPPKGLLLYGPPGCSKTLSAQALATESGFNFFSVKAAELLNMYVGESERAVRNLFERARRASPSIIFFDEIDSIGGQRGAGPGARTNSSVNMLTALLTEMDGFETLTGVLVLGATNRPEAIDPALMRPGRFDQALFVGLPDLAAREAIFKVHLQGLAVASDVDMAELARLSDGHSGAEIKGICLQAGLAAEERVEEDESGTEKLEIQMADLKGAIESTPAQVTRSTLDNYERWFQQFKKTH